MNSFSTLCLPVFLIMLVVNVYGSPTHINQVQKIQPKVEATTTKKNRADCPWVIHEDRYFYQYQDYYIRLPNLQDGGHWFRVESRDACKTACVDRKECDGFQFDDDTSDGSDYCLLFMILPPKSDENVYDISYYYYGYDLGFINC